MWNCMKCGEEVEDNFEICWSCSTSRDGTRADAFDPEAEGIISRREFEAQRQARIDERLVQIAAFSLPQEAHFLKLVLEEQGIPACIADEEAVLTNWLIQGLIGGIKVLVLENDEDRARAVFARLEREQSRPDTETHIKDDYGLDFRSRDRGDERIRRQT